MPPPPLLAKPRLCCCCWWWLWCVLMLLPRPRPGSASNVQRALVLAPRPAARRRLSAAVDNGDEDAGSTDAAANAAQLQGGGRGERGGEGAQALAIGARRGRVGEGKGCDVTSAAGGGFGPLLFTAVRGKGGCTAADFRARHAVVGSRRATHTAPRHAEGPR